MASKHNGKKGFLIALVTVISVLALVYLGGSYYYQGHFLPETVMAATDISHQSPEEAESRLKDKLSDLGVKVTEKDQVIKEVKPQDVGIQFNINSSLEQVLAQQNAWTWPLAWFNQDHGVLAVEESKNNEAALKGLVNDLAINNAERQAPTNAQVVVDQANNQLSIKKESHGNQVSKEKLGQLIQSAIDQGQDQVKLEDAYLEPQVKSDDPEIQKQMEQFNKISSMKLALNIEDKDYPIDPATIQSWLIVQADSSIDVDRSKISAYLQELNQKVSGLLNPHEFKSTMSGTVTIFPGIYGWYIDRDRAVEEVAQAVLAGEDKSFEPSIAGQGYKVDNFFGDTYIEVDIPNQKLFLYENGQLSLETDVITGQDKSPTIPGANEIWNMESPSILRANSPITGIPYEQPVDYWMAFDYHAEGIHDAKWQPAFGGQLYRNMAGSYGCVNTSINVMPTIFAKSYVGMPVVIFNEESLH
ncbi:L,D-transpeptidase family protein [Aerococcus urinae]|uniref:Peptidoglycan binding domain-containing protein n=1 Tax=Aerococcus urinae TaxID=1376 RepID=A0A109REZ2_9LACT|nr:L,D-transpeptidase family protein [Aerococcus urinae]AMB96261.1 hypothetical protein AWM73_06985 [Aerococcus urinae]MCY3033257.1 peptidoglycan binding domain-containing protein [Aerococcus urinae]MCY3038320.1 peptidoglycan binding domain-containing protein [Aerococcus urinae]MCY3045222.1 peptidoglycan binding domain-containing protein [Aerococcus urinae]MCY3046812.1 peptidoglycan binding domain-containing protein [Aerococcus urinae]